MHAIIPDSHPSAGHRRSVIAEARQLAGLSGAAAVCGHAGTEDRLLAYVAAFAKAQRVLADLADHAAVLEGRIEVLGGLDDEDEDQAAQNLEPYCYTCGASIGIFIAHGDAWLHYTGQGTLQAPVVLFDAGHEPVVAWCPAGAR